MPVFGTFIACHHERRPRHWNNTSMLGCSEVFCGGVELGSTVSGMASRPHQSGPSVPQAVSFSRRTPPAPLVQCLVRRCPNAYHVHATAYIISGRRELGITWRRYYAQAVTLCVSNSHASHAQSGFKVLKLNDETKLSTQKMAVHFEVRMHLSGCYILPWYVRTASQAIIDAP